MSVILDLSDKDRLILENQYEILSKLDKANGDSYAELAENLRSGHEWLYRQVLEMSLSENLAEKESNYVLRILGIYGDLYSSYEKLEYKSGIEAREVVFPGFDGNNEIEFLSFTGAFAKARKFTNTLGKDGNTSSHMPTTGRYRRMIERWEKAGKPNYPLSKADILQILHGKSDE
jgi:uncharacterized protein YfbU (UPF0304 family)